jgi:NADH dehydrogenase
MGEKQPFVYDSIGSLAVLGHRTAVAELKGMRFAGFPAWWMWRTVYWSKLPSLERRLRVATDWTLDLFFPPDTVQLGSGTIPHDELDHEGPEHHPEHSHHAEPPTANGQRSAQRDAWLVRADVTD